LAQVARIKPKGRVSALATTSCTVGPIVPVPRSTTSSKAVVVSSKETAPKKHIETRSLVDEDAGCGFLEEEEEGEREAALSSPVKGKKMLNSSVSHILVLKIALF
jgi:hypothetical protein